jgi:uncharacterized protein YgiM (DUF1202 family)
VTTFSRLNLRSGPGAHYQLIAKLAHGEVVRTVTAQPK